MIVSPGLCVTCEKPVAAACPACGAQKFAANFTEVTVQWSNGSRMPIGICTDCSTGNKWNTPEAKAGIAKAHFDYWDKMGGTYDPEISLV